MIVLVVAVIAVTVGFCVGHAHARWIVRDEFRGLAGRIGEYTRADLVPVVLTRLRERLQTDTPDPGKPW